MVNLVLLQNGHHQSLSIATGVLERTAKMLRIETHRHQPALDGNATEVEKVEKKCCLRVRSGFTVCPEGDLNPHAPKGTSTSS